MFNWVTLLLLKELIQTSVFDAHCQGREEVSSFVPAWVAHPPVRRAHAMTPLSGHQACVLWQSWGWPRAPPPQWCLYYTTAVDTHTVTESEAESAGQFGGACVHHPTRICQRLSCTRSSAKGLGINSWFMPIVFIIFFFIFSMFCPQLHRWDKPTEENSENIAKHSDIIKWAIYQLQR